MKAISSLNDVVVNDVNYKCSISHRLNKLLTNQDMTTESNHNHNKVTNTTLHINSSSNSNIYDNSIKLPLNAYMPPFQPNVINTAIIHPIDNPVIDNNIINDSSDSSNLYNMSPYNINKHII
jgi:hypothetical protein